MASFPPRSERASDREGGSLRPGAGERIAAASVGGVLLHLVDLVRRVGLAHVVRDLLAQALGERLAVLHLDIVGRLVVLDAEVRVVVVARLFRGFTPGVLTAL